MSWIYTKPPYVLTFNPYSSGLYGANRVAGCASEEKSKKEIKDYESGGSYKAG